MRFNEMNVHGQCRTCNRFREGNRQGYREGLIKRYGEKVVKELDVKRSVKQNPWTSFEYLTMIDFYKQKLKKLLKTNTESVINGNKIFSNSCLDGSYLRKNSPKRRQKHKNVGGVAGNQK